MDPLKIDMNFLPPEILSIRQNRTLSMCEVHMQKDLEQETVKPKSTLERLRKQGDNILHSSIALMIVVVLNCIDCLLVLSELMLDVSFINGMIHTAENTMEKFNKILQEIYPEQFSGLQVFDTHIFYNRVLQARLVWNNTTSYDSSAPDLYNRTKRSIYLHNDTVQQTGATFPPFQEEDDPHFLEEHVHSLEEKVAHVLHQASVVILGILVVYTLLKMFCHGLSFLKHKLEVFDGIVVIASFTLDVCYIKGLTNYPVESFLFILIIMIPWRIIRVLNSLVIAVKDNFHFLLKLMYKKIKYQREKIQQLEAAAQRNQNLITALSKVCERTGVSSAVIQDHLDLLNQTTNEKKERPFPLIACFSRQTSSDPAQESPATHGLEDVIEEQEETVNHVGNMSVDLKGNGLESNPLLESKTT